LKALAKFILRGRLQALLVGFIGGFFPLISTAAIALVSICKGVKEGTLLFLWVSLLLVFIQQMSGENPLLTAITVASSGVMVLAATVHKYMASWQWTLLSISLGSLVSAFVFGLLMSSDVTELLTTAQTLLQTVNSQQPDAQFDLALTEPMLLGLVATIMAAGSIMSMMLARWWQAGLFNPGGFQKEFHDFAIQAKVAVILIALLIAGQLFLKSYQLWADLAALPLLIAGLALVHFAVKLFGLGRQWIAFVYIGMIMMGKPVTLILVILAFTDSLIDLRSRLVGFKNSKA